MWKQAIKTHKRLLTQRPDPSWWSENIVDASSILEKPEDWRIFYMYLTDGDQFDMDNPQLRETVGEQERNIIPDYDSNQEVTEIQNGPYETYVMVNTVEEKKSDDDEKIF
jgi:hypothetical protein